MVLPRKDKSTTKGSSWKNLLIWILLALLIRWQVIEPRWIPSGSMLPTLQIQERLLVEKISPKFNSVLGTPYHRNSIVVFLPPKALTDAGYEGNQALIKRIVGIPGDKIEIKNGRLYRNDLLINEPWVIEKIKYEMKDVIVPMHSLWVLGDNRNNSLDSHLWGALPEDKLVGKAVFRYWPLKKLGPIRFPASKELSS
ncbi:MULTISPECIES: signal peptidase I [Prochlorococcus]|uniref:Signal peptidase I n=1 Tax=Prochlorococcus marinus (strain SARG / CCMP1375 / SS120) TaxID=167539 RepID=Q7VBN7_PROMA|nr:MULTISPECIES: signal peptidase I [Prochlorococcus]AAQ00100.1 Signal peptidase I [Prochlorococcus marinus subsp. marinus str. CCMP1375]KGG13896.1 Signal peptidase I [Prochlorococcus marinus str. LG]KGG19029.1 Signal peptidase I [Prochlorococcus marinus str. SS2]KGG23431.1 Signal peptidase I [Prochlorococcus marinus str. SS35]KGG32333.1 Signal peptidase I [Prochlorococcus marinus str. SS51]